MTAIFSWEIKAIDGTWMPTAGETLLTKTNSPEIQQIFERLLECACNKTIRNLKFHVEEENARTNR